MKKKILSLMAIAMTVVSLSNINVFAAYVVTSTKTEYYMGENLLRTEYGTKSMSCPSGQSPKQTGVDVKTYFETPWQRRLVYTYSYKCG